MDKNVYFNVPMDTLLPNCPEFRLKYQTEALYYKVLAQITQVIRDNTSPLSLYKGEEYDDYVALFVDDLPPVVGDDFNAFLCDIEHRAGRLNQLLPEGIFERLDFYEATPKGIAYVGILHDSDYR